MTPRIAVVGAGLAGLTAALTLRDAGLACELYEASNRVGGRMHSDSATWADGQVSEWCGEFIGSDHTTLHQLIARFGLTAVPLDRGHAGGAPSLMYLTGRFYGPEELTHDFQAIAPLVRQQYQEAGFPTTYAHYSPTGQALDLLSASEWIERYVPGGHAAPLGHYLNAACTGFYGLDSAEQSALNLLYLVSALGAENPPDTATEPQHERTSTPQPMRGNSKIVGGNEQLPQAIARALPAGCIHLGHPLAAIERADDGSLTLMFATVSDTTRVSCDYAILALPFSTLRRVDYRRAGFDALKQTAIAELGYGTISKLCLEFDQPYWYSEGPWPRTDSGFFITDLAIQTLWDTSIGQTHSPTGTSSLLVDYTSGHHGAAYAPPTPYATTASADAAERASIEQYAQDCLRQLERVFPGISVHYTGRAALSYPTGDPYLLGSYACWRVGQYTRFAGYEGARQGPVLFAGEHCSLDFQGYMEGAAREGARAAREILRDLEGIHAGA